MSTIGNVNTVLGKDFDKLSGPDNYNTWLKLFTELALTHGYAEYYDGTSDILEKPQLPAFALPQRTATIVTSIANTSANNTAANNTNAQVLPDIPKDATAQLAIYEAQLREWKDNNKTVRSALALIRASVEPWVWKEIEDDDKSDPHAVYKAIQKNNKVPSDVIIDRALTKMDTLKLTDPVAIRAHVIQFEELHDDLTSAGGSMPPSQLIHKITRSLPPQYHPFTNF
jgi:hypothetical protein